MQLHLFAVRWKITLQYVRMSFVCPKVLEINLPRLRMSRNFLQELSRQSGCPLLRSNWVEYYHEFSIRSGFIVVVLYMTQLDRKSADWRWFPSTGPLKKRETARDRLWRTLWLILVSPISNIFGAKAHAKMRTYWKVLFQRTANPTA